MPTTKVEKAIPSGWLLHFHYRGCYAVWWAVAMEERHLLRGSLPSINSNWVKFNLFFRFDFRWSVAMEGRHLLWGSLSAINSNWVKFNLFFRFDFRWAVAMEGRHLLRGSFVRLIQNK